jgi:hypothetical protein
MLQRTKLSTRCIVLLGHVGRARSHRARVYVSCGVFQRQHRHHRSNEPSILPMLRLACTPNGLRDCFGLDYTK